MEDQSLLHKILAPKDLKEKRLKICAMCPHFTGKRCRVCGCFMIVKAGLKNASCPNGYWAQKLVEEKMFGVMDDRFDDTECCKG